MNDTIQLADFIDSVFQNVDKNETPIITQPLSAKGFKNLPATKRKLNQIETKPDQWYVCVSTVIRQQPLKRRREDCRHVHVIMLDDIGTKAHTPNLVPNCVLETSPDNYQYLYFIEPYALNEKSDIDYFEAVNKAICEAGFGDKGAGGVYRVFRLPGSINRKPGRNNWQTRIVHWSPQERFTIDEVLEGLDIVVETDADRLKSLVPYDGIVPDNVEDSLFTWLKNQGRILNEGEQFYEVECPWKHLHTAGTGTTAGYSPLGYGDIPEIRGFHCFHDHCINKTFDDYALRMIDEGAPRVSTHGDRVFRVSKIDPNATYTPIQRYQILRDKLESEHVIRPQELRDVRLSKDGVPLEAQLATHANVINIVEGLGIRLRVNMLTHDTDLFFKKEELQALTNSQDDIRSAINDTALNLGIKNEKLLQDSVNLIARYDAYHPAAEVLFNETWDNVDRLPELADTVTLVDERQKEAFLKAMTLWLLQVPQAVLGWRTPKSIPYVLVFSGEQGIGKTSWFQSLVPFEFFKEGVSLSLSKGNAVDTIREATSSVIAELGELETTFSKSATGELKIFLSKPVDEYRVPYSISSVKYSRSTVYCGTVNKNTFLTDDTGNRRFWPFSITGTNPLHNVNMAQVWAQVKHIYDTTQVDKPERTNDIWVPGKNFKQELDAMATSFRSSSFAEEAILEHFDMYKTPGEGKTVTEVRDLINADTSPKTKATIETVMDRLCGKRRKIKGRRNTWMWPTTPKESIDKLKVVSLEHKKGT